jgi:hypothetical protein
MFSKKNMHCNENPIYVFPERELRGISPNFYIHVPVSDLYIPRIGPHIFLQQNPPDHGSQTHECMWKLVHFLFWEYFFQISDIVSLQCGLMKTFYFLKMPLLHINSDVSVWTVSQLPKLL